jgi:hypothetical protein
MTHKSFMYLRAEPPRSFICGFDHIGGRVANWAYKRANRGLSFRLARRLLPWWCPSPVP